jgi:hypothetical protein
VSFLSPYMLWGSVAAAIPVALHFFFRSRYRTVPWAAMPFLLASIEQTSRRLRFQELLLLLTRIAVLLLLALALARPSSQARPGAGGGDTVDAVFLFDTSYSMDARDGSPTRLDRAKTAALAVLDHLPPHSTVRVVTCADRAESLGPSQPADFDQAREIINDLHVSHLATDLLPGLREAVALLGRGTAPNRELYLFSDMQTLSWERQAGPLAEQWRAAKELASVYLVRCGTHVPKNAAVVGVVPQTGVPRAGERVGFAVLVRNTGTEPLRDLTVSLTLDGHADTRESQPLAYLAPGETRTVTLSGKWDHPGLRVVSAAVGPDELDADNRLDLVVPVRDRIRVLVVDGALDEREPEKSASFYLLHALLPVKESERAKYHLQPRLVAPAQASPEALTDKDLCVLVNVRAEDDRARRVAGLSPEFAEALERYVRGGKALLIFAGDRVDPAAYNRTFGGAHGLLPLKLTGVRSLPPQDELVIDRGSARDPAYWRFRDDEVYKALGSVRTGRYLEGEEPPSDAAARGAEPVLLRFTNGKPLVAVRKAGAGRVMLVTTSADATWTDWPLWLGTYVPFVDVAVNHLLMGTTQEHNGTAGEPIRWWAPDTDAGRPFLLRRPDGRRVRLGLPEPVEGRPLVTATDTPQAGVYHLLPADAEAEGKGVPFALAADLQEGLDLEALTDAQLDERLGFAPVHLTAGDDLGVFAGGERLKREWAPWLLAAVLALAAFEAVFAWWCGQAR